jgi:hypothetical protein
MDLIPIPSGFKCNDLKIVVACSETKFHLRTMPDRF